MDASQLEGRSTPKGSGKVRRLRSLADLDRRTTAARAAFELRDGIISDLGGEDAISDMQRAIIDSAALLGAMLSDIGASYLSGQVADLGL